MSKELATLLTRNMRGSEKATGETTSLSGRRQIFSTPEMIKKSDICQ